MAVAYLERESQLTAAKWNELFSEADRKLSACLDNHSIYFARSSVVPDFFQQFTGQEFHFGSPSGFFRREIFSNALTGQPIGGQPVRIYSHTAFLNAAESTPIATEYDPHVDHVKKVVRLRLPAASYYNSIGRLHAREEYKSLFDYSLEVHTRQHRERSTDPFEPYYILGEGAAAIDSPGTIGDTIFERVHRFSQVELIFDGLTEFTFPANYNKYNFFRIHNLSESDLTVTFPAASLVVPAYGSKCIRRTSVNGVYTEGYNHFQKMLPGDLRIFNGMQMFGRRDYLGMLSNNVFNPSLLLKIFYQFSIARNTPNKGLEGLPQMFLDYSKFWDASEIYCNPNFQALSEWERNPPIEGKGFFGEVKNETPIGDLMYHYGDLYKVNVSGEFETHEKVTFRGFATIEEDFGEHGITIQSHSGYRGSPGILLTSAGDSDLIQFSTNLISGNASGYDTSGTSSVPTGEFRFFAKKFPIEVTPPVNELIRVTAIESVTAIPQVATDGTALPDKQFTQTIYSTTTGGLVNRQYILPSLDSTLGDYISSHSAFSNDVTTFNTSFRFTGFGPLFITEKSQPVRSYSSEGSGGYFNQTRQIWANDNNNITLSAEGKIVQHSVQSFPHLGWQKLAVEDVGGSVPGNPGEPPQLTVFPAMLAFHSPRVTQAFSQYDWFVQHSGAGTVFFPKRSIPLPNFYHPDFDFYFETGKETDCKGIKRIREKTGIAYLGKFQLQDPFFRLSNWALNRKTRYKDPIFTFSDLDQTDRPNWYSKNRSRLLNGGNDIFFGRWTQFNRLFLLVDYFNNIASYVNAVNRVHPLNFLDFFGIRSMNNDGVFSTDYLSNIRPAEQFCSLPDDDSRLPIFTRLGIPRRTDLPESFYELKNAKVVEFGRNSEGDFYTTITNTPLYPGALPTHYKWVSISDVQSAALARGMKFIYQQAAVPVTVEVHTASLNMLYGGLSEWVGKVQINYWGVVEQMKPSEWVADVSSWRLRSEEFVPAEIITFYIGTDTDGNQRLGELVLPEDFLRYRYEEPYLSSHSQGVRGRQPYVAAARTHPAFWLSFYGTNGTVVFEDASWIEYPERFSSNISNFHAMANSRTGFNQAAFPATIKNGTGEVTTETASTGLLLAPSDAVEVSLFWDSTIAV